MTIIQTQKWGRRIRRQQQQYLCLDKGYDSEHEEQELIKRGYVLHIPIKKKKKGINNDKDITRPIPNIKKYSPKRWVVERTNSCMIDLENCLLVMRKSRKIVLD